jgi:DNA-binding response OmpR family regulator
MRLLVVEDNEQLAGLLTKGLQTAGYETGVLTSLEEASTVLRTTFYAGLILDLGATITIENRHPNGACFSLKFRQPKT